MAKLIILILSITFQIEVYAQGVSKLLPTPNGYASNALKIAECKNGNQVIFGWYCDSNFRTVSGCYPMAYIYSLNNNKFTSLNNESTYYMSYGKHVYFDDIIRIDDSLFVYHFTKQQIGKEYQYWENWGVIFNENGDTIRTFKFQCDPLFGIENWVYDYQTSQIYAFGPDSSLYGLHGTVAIIIYCFDNFGNKIWSQNYSTQYLSSLTNINSANSGRLTLNGNINVNVDLHDGFRHLFTKFHQLVISTNSGQIISTKTLTDSIGEFESRTISNCTKLNENKVYAIGYPKSLFWISTLTSYEFWTNFPNLQEVMQFDSNLHLLKSQKIQRLTNDSLITVYSFIKTLNGNKVLLIGGSLDSVSNDPMNQYIPQGSTTITLLNNDLELKWSRNFSFEHSNYNYNYLVDAIEIEANSNKGYLLVGGTIESGTKINRSWYIVTDSLGCIEAGCQFLNLPQIIKPKNVNYLTIYPNPVTNNLNIKYDNEIEFKEIEVSILNVMGEECLKSKRIFLNESATIDTSLLHNGSYLLIIRDKSGKSIARKFIK